MNSIVNLTKYDNKNVVDLKLERDALWCLSCEDSHFNKTGLFKTASGDNTALSFRSYVDKYPINDGYVEESNTEKCLRNCVWTLDDQLLIEKIEDNEYLNDAIANNKLVQSRYLRRYGGDYVKDINFSLTKNSTDFQM